MGGDKSIMVCHVSVNEFFFVSKNQNKKKRKLEVIGEGDENIKETIEKL